MALVYEHRKGHLGPGHMSSGHEPQGRISDESLQPEENLGTLVCSRVSVATERMLTLSNRSTRTTERAELAPAGASDMFGGDRNRARVGMPGSTPNGSDKVE